ncbi:hypothetical protein BD779DRAFT_1676821 [Infundibulicybe gibba]|nr:hypothetical protein BD779DRAFT_1676821 [Infundibulicybe gibba]
MHLPTLADSYFPDTRRAHAAPHVWRITHNPVFYELITLEHSHPRPSITLSLRHDIRKTSI